MKFSHKLSSVRYVGSLAASSMLITALVLTGCNSSKNKQSRLGIDPSKIQQAAPQIESSFGAKSTDDKSKASADSGLGVDKAHVLVQKSALGKEFLLSVNILSQTPTPSFSSLQSRVVSLILRDDKVYMLDVTKNNEVGNGNIPQSLLIAEFPIISQDENKIEIDYNSGMSQIFEAADMTGSDDAGGVAEAKYKLSAANVKMSYLDEVSLAEGALLVRQVAQIDRGDEVEPVEVRYQIKPYLPNPDFKPVISPGFQKVGYFEANPLLLPDGSTRVYAMKWDTQKTIKFAISANTPEKYRDLVKSALLYWNKILGDQALEVVQLEDKSITAPHFDMNIIQWVDYDAAGAAYADAHVDPRSGEVTSAQIFFPSAFMENMVAKRARLTQETRPAKVSLKGFKSARLCSRNLDKDFAAREAGIEVSPEAADKAVRDYVYEVIAHELGHVFGLRHNFAASLAANYDFKDRKDLIMKYYKEKKAPEGIIASSSVMEYSRFEESAWNGSNFQAGGKALAYDEMAMNYLYKGTELPTENRPLFCTDSDINTYADCNQSDAGRSVISTAAGSYQAYLSSLAARILNSYITQSKMAESASQKLIPVSEVNLSAVSLTKTVGNDLAKAVSTLKDNAHFIAVQGPRLPILSTQKADVLKAEKDYVQAEFTRLGGLNEVLKQIPDDFDSALVTRFAELLEDPVYNSGKLADGSTYSFSDAEKQAMKTQVALFAPQMKEQLILNELKALSGANFAFPSYGQDAADEDVPWSDSDLTYSLAGTLLQRFEKYAISKTDQKVLSEITLTDGTKKQIQLPVYQYSLGVRSAAAGLFSNPHRAVDWGFKEKIKASEEMGEELSILDDPDKIDMNSLDRNILQWILNTKKLAGKIED